MIGMKTAAVAVFDVTSVRNTTTVATKRMRTYTGTPATPVMICAIAASSPLS